MKHIELNLKIHSETWLSAILLIFVIFSAIGMVSPINAAPPNLCDKAFCDQDGDGFYRDHKKCPNYCGGASDCDDNDDLLTDNCNGGGSDGYIQTNSPNYVIWGALPEPAYGLPYEANLDGTGPVPPRFCAGTGEVEPQPNPQGIMQYVCHEDADFLYGRDSWNVFFPDLSGVPEGELNASGRDTSLCDRLIQPFIAEEAGLAIIPKKEGDCQDPEPYCDGTPPNVGRLISYYIVVDESNDEPCTWNSNKEKSCHVTILTQGYFWNECRGNKCGRRIGIKAYGHVLPAPPPAIVGDPTEINPFTRNQTIVVEELEGFFTGLGTNRKEANCYLNNVKDEGGYHYSDLVFTTLCVGESCREE